MMEWPAQSPNLNPIENLWTDFKTRFHQRFMKLFNYASKSFEARYGYAEVLQEVWYDQGMEIVEALIKSMPERCARVIAANGSWTRF